jgi:uncharacterized protein YaeQ
MSLGATMHRALVTLSDVDRNVYESLDFRLARHPSESVRYLVTRTLAYCLCHEPGIAFSKGGLSSTDEPPLSIHDPTGVFVAWIDIGSPSAERLHRATKAAQRVVLFTHADLGNLQKEARSRDIHRVEEIEVWQLDPKFLDALGEKLERNWKLELVRSDSRLYVTLGSESLEGELVRCSLT